MIVISDTSPLVCLLHLNKIDLLKDLFTTVIIPPAVFEELIKAKIINETFLRFNTFIHIKVPINSKQVQELMSVLDKGESEAIVLSTELKTDLLLIDEAPGRAIARKYGIPIKRCIRCFGTGERKQFITGRKTLNRNITN